MREKVSVSIPVSAEVQTMPRRQDFTYEITVWCRNCANWCQTRKSKYSLKYFRSLGWKNRRGYGWLCPYCVNIPKDDLK